METSIVVKGKAGVGREFLDASRMKEGKRFVDKGELKRCILGIIL